MNPANERINQTHESMRPAEVAALNLEQFANTRARVIRLADSSQHAAWVPPGLSGMLQLAMTPIMDLEKGERFSVQLTNARQTVGLSVAWIGQHGNRYAFRILESDPPAEPTEQMRRRETDVTAVISGGGTEASVTVLDVAPGGIGIQAPFKLMLDTTMRISVRCPIGLVHFDAKVAYSREDPQLGAYRIGFQITRIAPNDQRLWDQYMVKAG